MKQAIKKLNTIATEATTALIGGGIGLLTAGGSIAASAGMSKRARKENHYYNEISADNADKRTRQLYKDFYSPEAQLKQIKEAGLSPSIMYGQQGGNIGQATPSGKQGQGVNVAPPTANFNEMMTNAIQLAQIKNLNEETRGKEIENDIKEETGLVKAQNEIKKIISETNLLNADEKGKQLQNDFDELRNQIQNSYGLINAYYESQKLLNESSKIFYEAKSAGYQAEYDEKTLNDRINIISQEYANLMVDYKIKDLMVELQKENINLTKEQVKKVKEETQAIIETISQKWEELKIYEQSVRNQKEWWEKQFKLETQHLDNEEMNIIWKNTNESVEIVKDIVDMGLSYCFNLGLGRMGKTTEKITEKYDNKGHIEGHTHSYETTRPRIKK